MATVNTLPLSIVVHLPVGDINRSYSAPDEYTKADKAAAKHRLLSDGRQGSKRCRVIRLEMEAANISARFIGRFSGHAGADLRLNKSGLHL